MILELGKITTLVGASDSGKSSVLRALSYLCLNHIRGDSFITRGRANCAVTLAIDNHPITRGKEKSSNFYQLDDQEYSAFGACVPEAISQLLNVSSLNFQRQLDAPFWLSLSAPEVARQLNEVVDLDVIDRVAEKLASHQRSARYEVDSLETQLESASAEETATDWFPGFEKLLSRIEGIGQRLTDRRGTALVLTQLHYRAIAFESSRMTLTDQMNRLSVISFQAQEIQAKRKRLLALTELAESVSSSKAVPPINLSRVLRLHKSMESAREAIKQLITMTEYARFVEAKRCRAVATHSALSAQVQESLADGCPLCGSEALTTPS